MAELGYDVNYVANEILSEKKDKTRFGKPNLWKIEIIVSTRQRKTIQYALSASMTQFIFVKVYEAMVL